MKKRFARSMIYSVEYGPDPYDLVEAFSHEGAVQEIVPILHNDLLPDRFEFEDVVVTRKHDGSQKTFKVVGTIDWTCLETK